MIAIERTLVVPLRNEVKRAVTLLEEIQAWPGLPKTEVLLVDDGSTDTTALFVRDFLERAGMSNARLLSLGMHEGKGGAVRAGMLAARGKYIAFTDVDLPFGLEGVERVFSAVEEGADVAVGARDLTESDLSSAPTGRRLVSAIFRTWVHLVAETGDVRDTQCGLKGFTREAAQTLFSNMRCRGLAFDIEILGRAAHTGLKVARIPVTIRESTSASFKLPLAALYLFAAAPVAGQSASVGSGVLCSKTFWNAALAFLVFLLVFSALWGNFDLDGGRDWDEFQADLLSARRSILEEGEAPFWMPYRAGGHDALADPQSLWLSPLGILVLALGFPFGVRTFIALCAGFGAFGALLLARRLGLSRSGGALLASVLFLSTPTALYTAGGIPQFVLGLAMLPWLVILLEKGTRWSALLCGAILALDLYGGDVNHFIFHALFLLVFAVSLAVVKTRIKPLLSVAVVGVSAFVFAAPKFVPVCFFAVENPRQVGEVVGRGGLTPGLLLHVLLDSNGVSRLEKPFGEFVGMTMSGDLVSLNYVPTHVLTKVVPETVVDWVNVGAYMGGGGVVLSTIGFLLLAAEARRRIVHNMRSRKRHGNSRDNSSGRLLTETPESNRKKQPFSIVLALAVPALLFLWLSFGTNTTPSAWAALQQLPVFSSLRHPARLLIYFLLFFSVLASFGLEWIRSFGSRFLGPRVAWAVVWVVVVLIALDVHVPSRRAFALTFCEEPIHLRTDGNFVQQSWHLPYGTTWYGPPVTPFVRARKGVVNGYCSVPTPRAAVPMGTPNYRGEAFFLEVGSAKVSGVIVTARRIEVLYETAQEGVLIVNQNWAGGWRAGGPAGTEVFKHEDGRIAVKVPPGSGNVKLCYTPTGFFWGFLALALGTPLLLFWAGRPEADS